MADIGIDEEFEEFLDKVNEISSVIRDLASSDHTTSQAALDTANRMLSLQEHRDNTPSTSNFQSSLNSAQQSSESRESKTDTTDPNRHVTSTTQTNGDVTTYPDDHPESQQDIKFEWIGGCVTKWNKTHINTEEMTPQERWMGEVEADARRRSHWN
ncbi:hypothetical protein Pmani_011080 [Petrolisthes manimaculis]|uniref:Uncharacterized protein n=1 Tax=Petrolisthes manimaculis TaxID=1843537 RepID=A0AAE1UES4_9EUCA|nr:hypothetical protein Pmani_011080 [Petrolisthes manimaculis]